jgi:hypothetical protein
MDITHDIAIEEAMRKDTHIQAWITRILFVIGMGIAVLAITSSAAAQTEVPPTESTATEVPGTEVPVTPEPTKPEPSKPEPTKPDEATMEPTATQPGSGGIVVTPPAATSTATPGGVAPGSIVVVLWSSDGGPIPAETTICIRNGCQATGQIPSGTKVGFDDADQGWHDVSVQNATGYADTGGSVKVDPGQRSTIELTLRATKPVAEAPPTHASGPIRVPPIVVVEDAQDTASWNAANLSSVNPPGGSDAAGVAVNALPATGIGATDRRDEGLIFSLGATLLLAAAALIVRRRAAR